MLAGGLRLPSPDVFEAVIGYQGDSAQRQAPEPAVAGTSRLSQAKEKI